MARATLPRMGRNRSERIADLEQKKKQIAARIVRLRNIESSEERKRRTRRLILIGSYMEHITTKDEAAKERLMKGLDGFLERDRDRVLFGLAPKEGSE